MQYQLLFINIVMCEALNMHRKKEKKKMDQEQRTNAGKLESIAEELRKVADLFNLAGYKCSPYELKQIDNIAQLAATCQKLARL